MNYVDGVCCSSFSVLLVLSNWFFRLISLVSVVFLCGWFGLLAEVEVWCSFLVSFDSNVKVCGVLRFLLSIVLIVLGMCVVVVIVLIL